MTPAQASPAAASLEPLALSYAHDLHRLLGDICDLPHQGRGSCTERAWDLMDLVIWYLDPNGPDEFVPPARKQYPAQPAAGPGDPSIRDKSEILLMFDAGVPISDVAQYFQASEAAVRQLVMGALP
jgi:hypothetical protein